jgi:hypothetical protein
MSLWAPDDATQPSHMQADHPHEHLVVNEAEAVAHYLTTLQDTQRAEALCVDCLLDNAGFELLGSTFRTLFPGSMRVFRGVPSSAT